MSDAMLHGVLRMPPELWRDDPLDVSQRHSRYIEASERIEADAREIERLRLALAHPRCSTSADGVPPPTVGTCR